MMTTGVIGGSIIIAFGIMNCFMGYRVFRLVLSIWGFILGGALAMQLAAEAPPLIVLIAGVFGSVLGALLIHLVFRVGIFLAGAVFGYLATAAALSTLGISDSPLAYALFGGAFLGVMALLLNELFVIILTAVCGAAAIVTGGLLIFNAEPVLAVYNTRQWDAVLDIASPAVLGIWLALAALGFLMQSRAARRAR
jgi:hypothetical protein